MPEKIHNYFINDLDIFLGDFLCAPTNDKTIYLRYCGIGEPTLHPNFIEIVKKGLNHSKVKFFAILSNGVGWGKETVDEFFRIAVSLPMKPIELVFSLDTLNPQTQFKIKKQNNIRVIVEQLIYLIDQKAKQHLDNVYPVFQMIILDENFSEVKEFCDFWTKTISDRGLSSRIVYYPDYAKFYRECDSFIWIKRRDSHSFTQEKYIKLHQSALGQLETDNLLKKENDNLAGKYFLNYQQASKFNYICSMFWYGINIAANGDVSPCCSDVNFDLKIGNLYEKSLAEIYRGEKMKQLRSAHINNRLINYPVCNDCQILYRGIPVDDEDVNSYINHAQSVL